MQCTVVGTASYDGSSCQLRFTWEGRICKKCTSSRRIKRDVRLSHRIKPVHEAATEFLDYLFREAGARRIYGFVEDDNLRSKRLCERLGMRYEGCMKEFISFVYHPDGTPRYEDTCIYAVLNKEWKNNKNR